jgi:hypothetical protein
MENLLNNQLNQNQSQTPPRLLELMGSVKGWVKEIVNDVTDDGYIYHLSPEEIEEQVTERIEEGNYFIENNDDLMWTSEEERIFDDILELYTPVEFEIYRKVNSFRVSDYQVSQLLEKLNN